MGALVHTEWNKKQIVTHQNQDYFLHTVRNGAGYNQLSSQNQIFKNSVPKKTASKGKFICHKNYLNHFCK